MATIFAAPLCALDLPAGAVQTHTDQSVASTQFPVTAASDDETRYETAVGTILRRAWSTQGSGLTSYQLIEPLRASLEADGYRPLFSCADSVCGGFSFRFELDLLPPPAMYVDLGDFQYFLGRGERGQLASVVTSRSRDAGFIHVTQVWPEDAPAPEVPAVARDEVPAAPRAVELGSLQNQGHIALDDLSFETGASTLAQGPFPSLTSLAEMLKAAPDMQIVLVGHTDNIGSLESNVSLSRLRAEAVRDRLIANYGVSPEQISAEGVGYLAPRASNATPEGRYNNRRVEAVVASTREN